MFYEIAMYSLQIVPLAILVVLIFLSTYKKTRSIGKILLTIYIVLLSIPTIFIILLIVTLSMSPDQFYQYLIVIFCSLLVLFIIFAIWNLFKKKIITVMSVISVLLCIAITGGYAVYEKWDDSILVIRENSDLLSEYAPYSENSKVAELDTESSLKITSDFPRLDGATALYPVYSAFAKAVYPEVVFEGDYYLACNKTTNAYKSVVAGTADIIFVAAPSEEQMEFAKENGVELEFTPIGYEGFVFFVNSENPIENVTVDEIQQIYSGDITKWSKLGVEGLGEIVAFQRNEGSGSQSALERLMEGEQLMDPPDERVVGAMGGIIEKTADYKNYKNSIGFSFRFYSTEMVKNNHIKLLSLNGVYPSEENIENGTYPISNKFFAVTRKDKTENVQKFLDWMVTAEAQSLVEKTGYTPIS